MQADRSRSWSRYILTERGAGYMFGVAVEIIY